MTELEKNILELVGEGLSFSKISKALNIEQRDILKTKAEMMLKGDLTEEYIKEGKDNAKRRKFEKDEKIQLILKYKRQGLSDNKIEKEPNIGKKQSEISRLVRECIRLGLISSEEIELAKEARKKEEKEQDSDRKRILEGVKRGELPTEIEEDTTIGYAQIKNIIIEFIDNGIITEEEIINAREERKKAKEGKEKSFIEIDKEVLLSHLVLGYDIYDTRYRLGNVDPILYAKLRKELIKEGRITKEEIKAYREKREEEYKKEIFELLKKGTSQRKISSWMGFPLERTQTYIKKIKIERNISNKEIEKWKAEREDSIEKKREAILDGLTKGLTRQEIITSHPKQNLTDSDVKNGIKILKKEGKITQEEIEKYRKLREERKNGNNKLTHTEQKIFTYVKIGVDALEIAELMGKSKSYIFTKIWTIRKKGYITKKQIEEARERRKKEQEEQRKKRESEKEEKNFKMLKIKIERNTRLNMKLTQDDKAQIREYIDACYEYYKDKKMSKPEIEFLGRAIAKIKVNDIDIIKFAKLCAREKEYGYALEILDNRKELDITLTEEQETKFVILERSLQKASKICRATQMINRGNTNTETISKVTGLSRDKINILKISISGKPTNFLGISGREKVIGELLHYKDLTRFYRERAMSDFEIQDIENQAKYRRIPTQKRDNIQEIRQDSRIRITALCTKLGRSSESIAKALNVQEDEIREDLEKALNGGLIKENELKGIRLLQDPFLPFKEIDK